MQFLELFVCASFLYSNAVYSVKQAIKHQKDLAYVEKNSFVEFYPSGEDQPESSEENANENMAGGEDVTEGGAEGEPDSTKTPVSNGKSAEIFSMFFFFNFEINSLDIQGVPILLCQPVGLTIL